MNAIGTQARTLAEWTWPSWLTAEWVAADPDGNLWAYSKRPSWSGVSQCWLPAIDDTEHHELLDPALFDVEPVDAGGAESIRRNPRS